MSLTLGCSISRALLSLPDLDINDHVAYKVVSLEPGREQWELVEASSMFMDGDFTTQRRQRSPRLRLEVEVRGADQATVDANKQALRDAAKQDTFVLTFVLNGETKQVYGEAADIDPSYQKERLHNLIPTLVLDFKRLPAPALGVI